jgi:hypothetical protein
MPPACICALRTSQRLNGFYSYLVLKTLSLVGRCSVNTNILASKIGVLHMSLKTKKGHFLDNGSNNFDYMSVIQGNNPLNKTA